MKSPMEIPLMSWPIPLIGSPLRSAKREAMVGAIVWVARKKGEWGKIRVQELIEPLGEIPAYTLFPQECWNAFHEMVAEGLLVKDEDEEGDFVEVTEKLVNLLTLVPAK